MKQRIVLMVCCLLFSPLSFAECDVQDGKHFIAQQKLDVYQDLPSYSFLKGRVIYAQQLGTIERNACVVKMDERVIGVVQTWYKVQYQSNGGTNQGWVLAVVAEDGNRTNYLLGK